MSLFGDEEPDPAISNSRTQTKSIFGDDPSTAPPTTSNSLFLDDPAPSASQTTAGASPSAPQDSSPWSLPTPKKSSRQDMVRNLLPASDVPEAYVDVFDSICAAGYKDGTSVGYEGVRKLMDGSGVSKPEQEAILKQVALNAGGQAVALGRPEFNVLLALIGLAQESEEATLDGVDERRKRLPVPSLPFLAQLKSVPEPTKEAPPEPSPPQSRRAANYLDVDPWGSPDVHKGHAHAAESNGAAKDADLPSRDAMAQPRTTSTITTYSQSASPVIPTSTPTTGDAGWDAPGFSADDTNPISNGFSASSATPTQVNRGVSRALGGGSRSSRGAEEVITVTLLPDKEGMFFFQHRNYEVVSSRRGSSVVRRYSDFVWLLDCLHKRYPFRQLPLLPPKRVAVNGTHIGGSDLAFVEKRRRGLVRFANALVKHPVLNQEQLVVMFLTVPTELAVWRKQATISVQEEFAGKTLAPGLEASMSSLTLQETFETVRAGIRRSADDYIGLCALMERLSKRSSGVAADSLRFSQALADLLADSQDTYALDTNDVPLLNEGIKSSARHLQTHATLLEDETAVCELGVLEDLKMQRDCLVSMRDLFDRRDRFAKDGIPQLERRIEVSEAKLQALRYKPDGMGKASEVERLEGSIVSDKQSIVAQHARGVLIKQCVKDELQFFQSSQYQISRLHQDWSQERVKYAELQADNWRAWSEEVDQMPMGE